MRTLNKHDLNTMAIDVFSKLCANDQIKLDQILSPYQETLLHYCIAYGYNDKVLVLIENGADLNSKTEDGNTPLMMAIEEKNSVAVDMLLEEDEVDLTIKNNKMQTAYDVSEMCKDSVTLDKLIVAENKNKRSLVVHQYNRDNNGVASSQNKRLKNTLEH